MKTHDLQTAALRQQFVAQFLRHITLLAEQLNVH
jgi:hypothetical protein